MDYAPLMDVLWTRRPLRQSIVGKYAEPRWHRFKERTETELVATCNRRLPLTSPVLPDVPAGGRPCHFCVRYSSTLDVRGNTSSVADRAAGT